MSTKGVNPPPYSPVSVCMDFADKKPFEYLRYCPLTTDHFPHGISINGRFTDKEKLQVFKEEVEGYFRDCLHCEVEELVEAARAVVKSNGSVKTLRTLDKILKEKKYAGIAHEECMALPSTNVDV